ncbi:hypothetical protein A8924_2366 [Saccharopolyspora erythraea NRRL 2338]|uniref:Uncharacterized protein n=2 Tax=Saccharopolyspora erythraea TaxID=1836 RepID=A4FB49_SACEN|nr:hypothetical protein [Saccharopolyspora erythraea]EQD82952.1 hypothetical protein N599_27840 [Saccharopolyspora erythraea D]PFG95056.1 hypothetical protein A8924_2366 [Saccharopolyspora erythraea NRRL 2338]QRK91742.1 hypothetical protein JQX30_10390 [Saccharopolyspora erythraea]CAM01274.1 hypothetical protein SACE_1964 [Saccharopolyspora erythraea NRRL 2338]
MLAERIGGWLSSPSAVAVAANHTESRLRFAFDSRDVIAGPFTVRS